MGGGPQAVFQEVMETGRLQVQSKPSVGGVARVMRDGVWQLGEGAGSGWWKREVTEPGSGGPWMVMSPPALEFRCRRTDLGTRLTYSGTGARGIILVGATTVCVNAS
jgi:hypothetical protein